MFPIDSNKCGFFLVSFLMLCTHIVICVTQVTVWLPSLHDQSEPKVMDANVFSLTTKELCASLTVIIGICLTVKKTARH